MLGPLIAGMSLLLLCARGGLTEDGDGVLGPGYPENG